MLPRLWIKLRGINRTPWSTEMRNSCGPPDDVRTRFQQSTMCVPEWAGNYQASATKFRRVPNWHKFCIVLYIFLYVRLHNIAYIVWSWMVYSMSILWRWQPAQEAQGILPDISPAARGSARDRVSWWRASPGCFWPWREARVSHVKSSITTTSLINQSNYHEPQNPRHITKERQCLLLFWTNHLGSQLPLSFHNKLPLPSKRTTTRLGGKALVGSTESRFILPCELILWAIGAIGHQKLLAFGEAKGNQMGVFSMFLGLNE